MNYQTKDPRETLVETGNALLEVLYKQKLWESRYEWLHKLVLKGDQANEDEILASTKNPEFIAALVERMTLDSQHQKLYSEYMMLRLTIEALDTPRPPLSENFGQ